MNAIICLLRGVNVGGRNKVRMEILRALCDRMGFHGTVTYVQSGNVVFQTKTRLVADLEREIEQEFEREFGFRSAIICRTAEEMRAVIANSPFAGRDNIEPGKLLVTFLPRDPGDEARARAREIPTGPEELHIIGREMYIYFSNGMGQTKLPLARIDKALGMQGTARNWNTVLKLMEMAEA